MSDPINSSNIEWDEDEQVFKGKFIVGQDNDIVFKVKDDKSIEEGNETLSISIQNIDENDIDSITGKSVNDSSVKSKNVNIVDSSRSVQFFELESDKNILNELEIRQGFNANIDNRKLTLTCSGKDFLIIESGQIEFEVVGSSGNIISSDFNPSGLRGNLTVQNDTTAVGELFIKRDFLEEGEERFRVRLVDSHQTQTDEIIILDTSIPEPVFESVDIVPVDSSESDLYEGKSFHVYLNGQNLTNYLYYFQSFSAKTTVLTIYRDQITGGPANFSNSAGNDNMTFWTNDNRYEVYVPFENFNDDQRILLDTIKIVPDDDVTTESRVAKIMYDFWEIDGESYDRRTIETDLTIVPDKPIYDSFVATPIQLDESDNRVVNLTLSGTNVSYAGDNSIKFLIVEAHSLSNDIFASDFEPQQLYGYLTGVDRNTATGTVTIRKDNLSEDAFEHFKVILDSNNYISTGHISIQDSPTYTSITASPTTGDSIHFRNITEGDSITFTLNGSRMKTGAGANTELYWVLDTYGFSIVSLNNFFKNYQSSGTFAVTEETSQDIVTLETVNDNSYTSYPRYFYLRVRDGAGDILVSSPRVTVLENDAPPPTYSSLVASDYALDETSSNNRTTTITLTGTNLSGTYTCAILPYNSSNITLSDFSGGVQSVNGSLSVILTSNPAGTQATGTIKIASDGSTEGDESFRVQLNNDVSKITSPIIISDTSKSPTATYSNLFASDYSLDEDPPNNQTTITLTGTNLSGSYGCKIVPKNNSTITGSDFTSGNLNVTLTSNSAGTQATGTITIAADSLSELTETFYVELVNDPNIKTLDITINDTSKTVSTYSNLTSSPDELNESDNTITTITLTGTNLAGQYACRIVPVSSTITGSDFTSGNLDVALTTQTSTTATGTIEIAADSLNEGTETFYVELVDDVNIKTDPITINEYTSLTTSATTITESGNSMRSTTITLTGSNLSANSYICTIKPKIYWPSGQINGTPYNITLSDFESGGDVYDGGNGIIKMTLTKQTSTTATGTLTGAEDFTSEGTEIFYVELDADTSMKTPDISISDTSKTPVATPTFNTLSANPIQLDENSPNNQTTITLTGTNLSGSYRCNIVPVNSSSITVSDFSGGVVDWGGTPSVYLTAQNSTTATGTITIAADSLNEGTETFYVQLNQDLSKRTSNITIGDSEQEIPFPSDSISLGNKVYANGISTGNDGNRSASFALVPINSSINSELSYPKNSQTDLGVVFIRDIYFEHSGGTYNWSIPVSGGKFNISNFQDSSNYNLQPYSSYWYFMKTYEDQTNFTYLIPFEDGSFADVTVPSSGLVNTFPRFVSGTRSGSTRIMKIYHPHQFGYDNVTNYKMRISQVYLNNKVGFLDGSNKDYQDLSASNSILTDYLMWQPDGPFNNWNVNLSSSQMQDFVPNLSIQPYPGNKPAYYSDITYNTSGIMSNYVEVNFSNNYFDYYDDPYYP